MIENRIETYKGELAAIRHDLHMHPELLFEEVRTGAIVARDPQGLSGAHIGSEYDVQTSYRLDRNLELGAGVGYVRSGEFLIRQRLARSYLYPYVMINYSFF